MAFMQFLIVTVVLAAGISAKFVWQDDEFPNIPQPRMPTPPDPPAFPFFNFPPVFPFQPFPPGFPFNFANIPLPVVPTPGQIRDVKPGDGEVFHGVAVQSSSALVQDENGKWVRKGGTSVLANDNGQVHEYQHGNAPPDIDTPLPVPPPPKLDFPKFDFPEIKPLKFPPFPEIKPIKFPEFKMPKFEPIKPIDVEKMKHYQPKEGETYFGSSSSSFSNSRTVNGKTVSAGGSEVLVNDNGKTGEELIKFHKGDKLE